MHHVYTRKWFFLLILPIFIFFTLFSIVPLLMAVFYSFTNYMGLGSPAFYGVKNYIRMLQDQYVFISIANTLKVAATELILALPLSFLAAYFLNRKCLRNEAYKAVVFAPYVIPGIVTGLIWMFMLDPSIGLINTALRAVGLEKLAVQWIGGLTLTPYSIAIVLTWSNLGFFMSLWLMGMKNLPHEVLESSSIDGANRVQQIVYIQLPMLKETFKSLFIFILTGALKVYELVYILTGGGPNHRSESIVSYMFVTIFDSKLYGFGMAIAVLEFVLALAFTLLFLRGARGEVDS